MAHVSFLRTVSPLLSSFFSIDDGSNFSGLLLPIISSLLCFSVALFYIVKKMV